MDCKEISKIGLEAVYPDVTSKAQLRMQEIVVVQNQGKYIFKEGFRKIIFETI